MTRQVEATRHQERAIMMRPGRAVGGTLSLQDGKLLWHRTRWWPFHWMEKGPKYAEVELARATVALVGRQDPRWALLWHGGITNFVVGLFTGNLRECFAVRLKGASLWTYCFAVRDVDEWLTAIAKEEPMVEVIG